METTGTASAECRHHWVLGQPQSGWISALCKLCGAQRSYPAVLDDLDPGADATPRAPAGVATAAGGARPSAGAPDGEPAGEALLAEVEA
jgi:hypothetical protein